MVWPWSSGDQSSQGDNLDPSLRKFLNEEAQRSPPPPSAPPRAAAKASQTPSISTSQVQQAPADATTSNSVPKESQFQDGRYAHLWKTYEPISSLEARGKTDQEKLQDVIDEYNSKKARIGEIAQENCSLEYMQQYECYKHPSWKQLATVCKAESKAFHRCYTMQSKFLMALGYLTMEERSQEQYDRIQLHADKLYRQMLEQEEAIKKAKEAGQPIPEFGSIMSKSNLAKMMGTDGSASTSSILTDDVWKKIKPESRQAYEKKIAQLPKEEQEIERRALEGELRANASITNSLEAAFVEERLNRLKRRETGQATLGDMIKTWWGWG